MRNLLFAGFVALALLATASAYSAKLAHEMAYMSSIAY